MPQSQQIVQEVRSQVTVSQVQRVETAPVRHTEQYDQYDRNTEKIARMLKFRKKIKLLLMHQKK